MSSQWQVPSQVVKTQTLKDHASIFTASENSDKQPQLKAQAVILSMKYVARQCGETHLQGTAEAHPDKGMSLLDMLRL